MTKNTILVIVESPSKCKKIQDFLTQIDKTKQFIVCASCGHFREITSIDNKTFAITFSYIRGKKKYVDGIRKKMNKNVETIIATDNDREGEAIGWHLCDVLNLNVQKAKRLRFNEISKKALEDSYQNPDSLNMSLVDAQMTRQVVDRWIGYKFSPLVSKFCEKRGLSAGRCQTPTLKIVKEQNDLIKNKSHETNFRFSGTFHKTIFELNHCFPSQTDGLDFLQENISFHHKLVLPHEIQTTFQYPPKPLTTSKVQQQCSFMWKWSPTNTMKTLQKLYEDGLITYHRTESSTLSKDFTFKGRKWIEDNYGKDYLGCFRSTDVKTAHEAIRPTNVNLRDEKNCLYHYIWKTTVQSLMTKATINNTIVKITTTNKNWFLQKIFPKIVFDGFLILNQKKEDKFNGSFLRIKKLKPFEFLKLKETPTETQQQLNEGQIIAKLEKLGIGRPSTFASFVSKIQMRQYVDKKTIEKKWEKYLSTYSFQNGKDEIELEEEEFKQKEYNKIVINDLGDSVVKYLYDNFDRFFNYDYTAEIEKQLDNVANGIITKNDLLKKIEKEITR
jgi:DNA topoisomerase-1